MAGTSIGANIPLANGSYTIGPNTTAHIFRGQNVAPASLGLGVVIHMSGTTTSIVGKRCGKTGSWHPCLANFVHAVPLYLGEANRPEQAPGRL